MRKHLLLLCVVLLVSSQLLGAEETQSKTNKPNGKHPYKEVTNLSDKFSHWSLTFEGGINLIDGDFTQEGVTIIPESRIRPTGAVSVTYDFTPTWGLVGMYSFAPFGVKMEGAEKDEWLLNGQMHTIEALFSFDFIDAWFPQRKTNIFSLYCLAGAGLGFFNSVYDAGVGDPVRMPKEGNLDMTSMISIGAAAEFNVGRSVSLGLKGLYHIYTTDKIDSRIKGTNNDCMEYANLYLRWKIASRHRNHKRNYANDELLFPVAEKVVPAGKDTLVIIKKDTIVAPAPVDAAQLEEQMKQVAEATIVEHHLNTAAQCYYVYFDNNVATLSDEALQIIQQAAARMEEDSTICLEVSGFCDNTGSEEHNDKLAQRRADRVIRELKRVYKISDDRLLALAKGRITNVKSAYSPNRRVEMRLRSKAELEQLRKEKAPAQKVLKPVSPAASVAPISAVTPQETAVPVKDKGVIDHVGIVEKQLPQTVKPLPVNEVAKALDVRAAVLCIYPVKVSVTSTEITTFARLARKYYGNVYCWPYIYAANKKAVMNNNPDKLIRNVKVNVPELSEAEILTATPEAVPAMLEAIRTNVNIQL